MNEKWMNEWMAVDESVDTNWRYVVSHTTGLTHNCVIKVKQWKWNSQWTRKHRNYHLSTIDFIRFRFSFRFNSLFSWESVEWLIDDAFEWQFRPKIFAKNSRFENFGWNDIRWMEAMLRVCLRWFWFDLQPEPDPNQTLSCFSSGTMRRAHCISASGS